MDIANSSPLVPSSRPISHAAIWSIALGVVSLVPFVGLVAGPLAIILAIISRRKVDDGVHNSKGASILGILLGILGLLISLFWLINFLIPTSDFAGEKAGTVRRDLIRNAGVIELYKNIYGTYPDNLKELEASGFTPVTADPYLYEYYYATASDGSSYTLKSVGPDGTLDTDDDVLFSRSLVESGI